MNNTDFYHLTSSIGPYLPQLLTISITGAHIHVILLI